MRWTSATRFICRAVLLDNLRTCVKELLRSLTHCVQCGWVDVAKHLCCPVALLCRLPAAPSLPTIFHIHSPPFDGVWVPHFGLARCMSGFDPKLLRSCFMRRNRVDRGVGGCNASPLAGGGCNAPGVDVGFGHPHQLPPRDPCQDRLRCAYRDCPSELAAAFVDGKQHLRLRRKHLICGARCWTTCVPVITSCYVRL